MSVNTIFGKIYAKDKVELQSEIVELASMQQIYKLMDEAVKLKGKSFGFYEKWRGANKDLLDSQIITKAAFDKVIQSVAVMEAKLKELGITLPDRLDFLKGDAIREGFLFGESNKKLQAFKL